MFQFIHAADFHMDSAFSALTPRQAAARRRESRELPARLAEYVGSHPVDLVLLAGDLFDSDGFYRETAEALRDGLGQMAPPVFIAPGNHDWCGPGSPYTAMDWPENVHIFRTGAVESVPLPALHAVVHGAAFTAPEQRESLLRGFRAPEDGNVHLMVLHGELDPPQPRYDPIAREEAEASGLHYLALGHIHRRGSRRLGGTLCAWPGCPEGRGFDELGEKGFYHGIVDGGAVTLQFVPFARRRYEILQVDVTGRPPLAAVEEALPEDTRDHLYRLLLTGETGEGGVDTAALREALTDRFYALELRDQTRVAEDVWARAGEDSLRGLFLRELHQRLRTAATEEERAVIQQAARFGLAALDHRDLG